MTYQKTIHSDNYTDRFIFLSNNYIPTLIRREIIIGIQTASIDAGIYELLDFEFEFDGGRYNEARNGTDWTITFYDRKDKN